MRKVIWVSLILCLCNGALAAPGWPVTWNGLPGVTGNYIDALTGSMTLGDNVYATASPSSVNIVGDATYAAGYWAVDASVGVDAIMFRMRVDGNPLDGSGALGNYVWTALLNLDGDTPIEYAVQLDNSGADNHVELVAALSGGPDDSWQSVVLSTTNLVTGALGTYSRTLIAGDGSNFNGNADYFVDFALPLTGFEGATGWDHTTCTIGVAYATSTSHLVANKDLPDYFWDGITPVQAVPAPGAFLLGMLGLSVAGVKLRKHS